MPGRDINDIPIKIWEVGLDGKPWKWCFAHCEQGTWYANYGLMRSGPSTYWFQNSEDALAFSLQFSPYLTPQHG